MMEAAKSLGIDVSRFNTEKRISGRDYVQRIRRARHKLLYKKVSIPTSQPTSKLHSEIHRRLNNKVIYVGEKIARKRTKEIELYQLVFEKNQMSQSMDGRFPSSTLGAR